MHSSVWPRILAEELVPFDEPLSALVGPGAPAAPRTVASRAARALLALPDAAQSWPDWLAPHQVPAAERIAAIIARHGGALLADAAGLGKSYVALAVARAWDTPPALIVPAVLVSQWRSLLARLGCDARIATHEALSGAAPRVGLPHAGVGPPFVIVDEAHRFRNPATRRYGALARLAVGARLLLVTATPIHNRLADLFQLFRLFLRDHALTALGVPSLRRAAEGAHEPDLLAAVAARLVVARSRAEVRRRYAVGRIALAFPARAPGQALRAASAPPALLAELVAGIGALAGGPGAALLRVTLLRRLASSGAALRATLARHEALLRLARDAASGGRVLTARDFGRLFPARDEPDLQLALFPLLLAEGAGPLATGDPDAVARLRTLARAAADPKADALARLLVERPGKTIVFTDAVATARYLARRLGRELRVAAVFGRAGLVGGARAARTEVLRAFAPEAQGAARPARALETDVLIATDLLSEGLNLQDAARVIHYDLPWSPARLAQRVGRVDRLGSPHARVETVTFLPAEPLARALRLEARLAAKSGLQARAGAAELEAAGGDPPSAGRLDWCDRLHCLVRPAENGEVGSYATIAGARAAVVLVIRIGAHVEALVVRGAAAVSDPAAAAAILERAAGAEALVPDAAAVRAAIRVAAPLLRARLAALRGARWRAADRDRLARRLIPWVFAAARRAVRRGDGARLAALDALVARLALGLSAGEELLLDDLLARPAPLAIDALLRWHEGLPPLDEADAPPVLRLVAAIAAGDSGTVGRGAVGDGAI